MDDAPSSIVPSTRIEYVFCCTKEHLLRRILTIGVGLVVALLLLIQLIPIRPQPNPPVLAEPAWDSPGTRTLAQRACFDCHSNEADRWADRLARVLAGGAPERQQPAG